MNVYCSTEDITGIVKGRGRIILTLLCYNSLEGKREKRKAVMQYCEERVRESRENMGLTRKVSWHEGFNQWKREFEERKRTGYMGNSGE